MSASELRVEIREGKPEDEAFIFQTWLLGMKKASYEVRRMRDGVYFARWHRLIEDILERGATVLVACPPGDPDTILGYVVAETAREKPVIHFCYVKLPWRRLGIATKLITARIPDPNQAAFSAWTVWNLAIPAPKGIDRGDRKAVREARSRAVREAESKGEAGGDTEDLLRKWPRLEFDPTLKFAA